MIRVRSAIAIVTCLATLASLVACGQVSGQDGDRRDTFVFAAASKPINYFDPIFNDDGETFRVLQQMYDTLVTHRPGTAELAPGLAQNWELSDNGRTIKFFLRRNIVFHDGTPLNARAVCANFNRWFNMTGEAAQTKMVYYTDIFEGFKSNEIPDLADPIYRSCAEEDEYTAVLNLNRYKGAFPAALTLPPFAISSPTAFRRYNADVVTQSGDTFRFSDYATKHPTGTGPFKFDSYDADTGTVTLVRNDKYWGEPARMKKLVFRVVSEADRKGELLAGRIDGYDFPASSDIPELEKRGAQIDTRPPFNLLYLGINQKRNAVLADIRVRKAIAYAIDREALINEFPRGATLASQFVPRSVNAYAEDIAKYSFNQAMARDLMRQADAVGTTIAFYYPTGITRPYMPNAEAIYKTIASDLEAVGFRVQAKPEPWEQYLVSVREEGKHDLHLLGWTGDYNDAGNFLGTFFGRYKVEFGFNSQKTFDDLAKADAEPDPVKHAELYADVNRDLMERSLPAVPLVHSPPVLVLRADIRGLLPSPLTDERFDTVYKK